MSHVAQSGIEFLEPWSDFVCSQADAFLRELKSELAPGHPLYGLELSPLGHSDAADDALFEAEDGRIYQVHLTFSPCAEKTPLPRFEAYASLAEWIQAVMLADNENYRG